MTRNELVSGASFVVMERLLFVLISGLAPLLFYWATAGRSHAFWVYMGWCLIIVVLSYIGFFENTTSLPPRMLLALIPGVVFVVVAYKTAVRIPIKPRYLLAIHGLRLPLEVILYQLYLQGLIPAQMTFCGWNFDIISGLSAVLLLMASGLNLRLSHRLFRAWNILGLMLLGVIVATALLSAPSFFQMLGHEQPNIAILRFPYTLLPALLVPLVMLSHLLLLRRNQDPSKG